MDFLFSKVFFLAALLANRGNRETSEEAAAITGDLKGAG